MSPSGFGRRSRLVVSLVNKRVSDGLYKADFDVSAGLVYVLVSAVRSAREVSCGPSQKCRFESHVWALTQPGVAFDSTCSRVSAIQPACDDRPIMELTRHFLSQTHIGLSQTRTVLSQTQKSDQSDAEIQAWS